jgi:hydroxyethylthiazole kinase-like uncharacterized protein yjeF
MERNHPTQWSVPFPFPKADDHKYSRGAALIVGGGRQCTGAAKLAATAALRVCGLSMIAAPDDALPIYAAGLQSVMVRDFSTPHALLAVAQSKNFSACLVGPGNGVGEATKANVLALLSEAMPAVLDADALTSFVGQEEHLKQAIQASTILTPHEGEFVRLFGAFESREQAVQEAARTTGAVVVFKGAKTLIASPDGRLTINDGAPPWLATAGTGDVLAGLIVGLLAQAIPAHDAACMAVWLHSRAAERAGVGMLAEELQCAIPHVLADWRGASA